MNKKIEEEYPILKSFFKKSDKGNQVDIIIDPFSSKEARKLNCEEHLALMDILYKFFKQGRLTRYFNLHRECGPDESVFGEDSPEKSFIKDILSKEIDLIYELIANNSPERKVLNYLAIAKSHLPINLQGNIDKEFLRFRNTIKTQFDLFSTKLNLKQNEERVGIQEDNNLTQLELNIKDGNHKAYILYGLGIFHQINNNFLKFFDNQKKFSEFVTGVLNFEDGNDETIKKTFYFLQDQTNHGKDLNVEIKITKKAYAKVKSELDKFGIDIESLIVKFKPKKND